MLTKFNYDGGFLCYINLDSIAVVRDSEYRYSDRTEPSGQSMVWMHGCNDPWEVDGTPDEINAMIDGRESRPRTVDEANAEIKEEWRKRQGT